MLMTNGNPGPHPGPGGPKRKTNERPTKKEKSGKGK